MNVGGRGRGLVVREPNRSAMTTINQTAHDFDNDGSGSGFSSGSRGERLTGIVDNNTFEGGSGDGTLIAGEGNDRLIGGANGDALDGGIGKDTLDGGDGNDVTLGEDGVDSLLGGVGNDVLSGGAGDELFNGDDGNNDNGAFAEESGIESLDAGTGTNSFNDIATGTSATDDDDIIGAFTFDIGTLLTALS